VIIRLDLKLAEPICVLQSKSNCLSIGGYLSGLSEPKKEMGRKENTRRVKRIVIIIIN
jgi:hypothetical protein